MASTFVLQGPASVIVLMLKYSKNVYIVANSNKMQSTDTSPIRWKTSDTKERLERLPNEDQHINTKVYFTYFIVLFRK
jgi:hypothetical protein